jgi:hypothetical protein
VTACATLRAGHRLQGLTDMDVDEKQQLIKEIRESEQARASADPLAGLMHRWVECQDAQAASQVLARALSVQGNGDSMWPASGIWPLPPG